MPQNYEKKEVAVATRIPDSVKKKLDQIAYEHDRTVGYVIRELLGRALTLYDADGRLKDSPLDKPRRKLAPVVATISPPVAVADMMSREEILRTITPDEIEELERRLGRTQRIPVLKKKAR